MKKTAVLIHAQFLLPDVWEQAMWGYPENGVLGVIPKGLQLCKDIGASLLYLCSGIPVKGGREFSPDVGDFIAGHAHQLPLSLHLSDLFNPRVVQDNRAQNTREEIANASQVLGENSIEQVIMVTAPKHLPRVSKEAFLAKERGLFQGINILTTASDIDFPEAKLSDVAIIEPSHRHDVEKTLAHACVNATIRLMLQGSSVYDPYERDWCALLKKYGQMIRKEIAI